ncbi:ultraviolet-B receptor UVR8 isoform X1 [Prunus yedoensis var. nudiflora]|uniref:Ultraviolet-B receptor UVR8 isoform X1 n=1 Tax=Prunus yedoensis var. nudiflora TaxID=2094558 RepID=A0A314Y7X6_PRUYE|nr:ultraviolet-B receptor UVR8 isoform X1 [Prunus yedoensis var. nudiflora]
MWICRTRTRVNLGCLGRRRWLSSGSGSEEEVKGKRIAAVWGNGDYGGLGSGAWTLSGSLPLCIPQPLATNAFKPSLALGVHDDIAYTNKPLEVSGIDKEIVQISAGYHHSCAITAEGELYMWGKNSNGQLGLGKRAAKLVSLPTKVECLAGITMKMAALGSEHSVAIADGGESFSWGGGSGRLGHGHESGILGIFKSTSEYTPRLIKKLEGTKVKKVAAGMLHSACIDENGSVFIFDERALDKVGSGTRSKLPSSEEVACGGYHTCVLTSGGDLYSWGSNENGCLGIGTTDAYHQPERVQGPFLKYPVVKVSCGWKHTAAISEGNIFTWGWGGSHGTFSVDGHSSGGQLGHGTDVDYIRPTKVTFGKNVKALQVSCGFNHTGTVLEYT